MKIGFLSLGCPKNLVDGEVMLGMARDAGHKITSDAAGNLILGRTTKGVQRMRYDGVAAE